MTKTLIVTGGTIVTLAAKFRADLIVIGERIAGIVTDANDIAADERIDASGLLVMPGGIDIHTHFREPEEFTKEGFTSGSHGAAAGGITTVIEMPQADPTTINADQLRAKRLRISKSSIVDMALWGGVVGEPRQETKEIAEMAAAGAIGFKSFMASSSPSFPAIDAVKLLAAMRAVAPTGLPYAIHAEDDVMLQSGLRRTHGAGRRDALAHAESRPPVIEAVAVNTALYFAESTGCWVHICHCASADALRLITEARARGVKVTVETCPQYLALNTNDLVVQHGFARCAPALREQSEVDAIWPYVLDESIDVICSDHSAYTSESKLQGDEDIFNAPNGISGIQTLLPIFFDHAVNKRGMSETQFVRQIATNPAMMFGLHPRKGTIAIGSDADLVLFNPAAEWTVTGSDMLHKQKWTPFEGKAVKGRVIRTIRRGETTYDDRIEAGSRAQGIPGSGRFLTKGYGERPD